MTGPDPADQSNLLTVPPDPGPGGTKPPSRRAAILRTGLVLGILAIVFLVILPRYIDYQDVISALQAITVQQFLVITAVGVLAWIGTGAIFAALIPGLGLLRGTKAWLILAGIGASIPLGPWNMAVLWVVIRGWGLSAQATTGGIALYGVFDQLSRLAMGVVGALVLVLAEPRNRDVDVETTSIIILAVVSGVLLAITAGLLIAIVRSERLAHKLGDLGTRLVASIYRRLGRTGQPDVMGSVLRFRETLGDTVRQRGPAAFALSVTSKLLWSAVLITALRMAGVSSDVLPASEILAVFSIVFIITILPISPGGVGVPELLYISMFTTLTGGQDSAQISAGVMLYRVFQWFLPIPLAWILLARGRRGKSVLPTASEFQGRDDALEHEGVAPA